MIEDETILDQESTEVGETDNVSLEEIIGEIRELESLVQSQQTTSVDIVEDNYKPVVVVSLSFILAFLCIFCLLQGIKK